jgi:hypothetical protein
MKAGNKPELPPGRPAPPGAALFLDPQEGWLWSATEAASHKTSLYEPELWPAVARRDLPGRLAAGGISFVWLQAPDPEGATPRLLAEYFLKAEGRLLVVGDRPADLEPLAGLPGALFTGPAGPDSPLSHIALAPELARRQAAREAGLAEGQRRLAELRSAEAAQRSRLSLWTDLDELERRFKDLGQDLQERSREWTRSRAAAAEQQSAWEAAARKTEGLWARLSRSQAQAEEQKLRQALETAEAAVREVRRAEEAALAEARNLEERLSRERRESTAWPARADLAADLDRLSGEQQAAAEALAAEAARPLPEPDQLISEAPLVLALAEGLAEFGRLFPAVLRLASLRPDPPARRQLAGLVLNAERHLVIIGDFTFWPVWSGRAPGNSEDRPAWRGFKVAEEENELREFLAAGGLFQPARPKVSAPRLARLELGTGPADASADASVGAPAGAPVATGLGLRALGEMGPVNPASALAVARAALDFARARPEGPAGPPAALILTASPAQGRLINLMLEDLGAPPGQIIAGEPQAFNGWPRAPLVILEPAFETPHHSHPWAWPTFGRWRLQLAWALAAEEIWLAGREDWLRRLPTAAPLAALWRAAAPGRVPPPALRTKNLRILSQARSEIWAFLPAPGAGWWPAWETLLLDAAGRGLAVTVLTPPPGPEDDSDFIGAALRKLGTHHCAVGLASGFPGFLAALDNRHLIWGAEGPDFQSGPLPLAAPFLAEILQLQLIIKKISRRGGGLKACRRCGRPLVLVNQTQLRGLGDEQPLQVGCLGCRPPWFQRLDELRAPFNTPPKCGQDHYTPYQRVRQGRQEVWACPRHPMAGDQPCPSYRAIPGDCP